MFGFHSRSKEYLRDEWATLQCGHSFRDMPSNIFCKFLCPLVLANSRNAHKTMTLLDWPNRKVTCNFQDFPYLQYHPRQLQMGFYGLFEGFGLQKLPSISHIGNHFFQ